MGRNLCSLGPGWCNTISNLHLLMQRRRFLEAMCQHKASPPPSCHLLPLLTEPCLLLPLHLYGQAKVRQLHRSALELGGQQQVLRLPRTREKRATWVGKGQRTVSTFGTSPPGAWAHRWNSWTTQRFPVSTSSSNHGTLSFSAQRGDYPTASLSLLQQEDPSSTSHTLRPLPSESGAQDGQW